MKKKGCAASRAEQKLRFQENLDARVCEAHFCSTKDTSIGQPIYQYRETDMAFLKRVAARFGTSLFPGALSGRPELHFGLPDGKWHEEREGMTTSVRLDSVYDDFCRRWDHVRKEEFLCRDLDSLEQWAAGDYLSFTGGGVNRVLAVRATLENGLLVWHYETASEKVFQIGRAHV